MRFKNKKRFLILMFLLILIFRYIAYKVERFDNKLLLGIAVIASSIFYLVAVFEYFQIEEDRLIYVNPLGMIRKEIPWNEIVRIYVYSDNVLKAVKIGYGTLTEKEITIDFVIKDYKKLIKMILDKVEGNEKVSIDVKIDDFIK